MSTQTTPYDPSMLDRMLTGNAQIKSGIDVSQIRPILDRVLIRDIPDEEKIGSIFVPDTVRDKSVGLRVGEVVAVGLGDKWLEKIENNPPRVRFVGVTTESGRLPMPVQPGDRVVYDRHRECEIFIDGERLALIHAEQSIYGIIECTSSVPAVE